MWDCKGNGVAFAAIGGERDKGGTAAEEEAKPVRFASSSGEDASEDEGDGALDEKMTEGGADSSDAVLAEERVDCERWEREREGKDAMPSECLRKRVGDGRCKSSAMVAMLRPCSLLSQRVREREKKLCVRPRTCQAGSIACAHPDCRAHHRTTWQGITTQAELFKHYRSSNNAHGQRALGRIACKHPSTRQLRANSADSLTRFDRTLSPSLQYPLAAGHDRRYSLGHSLSALEPTQHRSRTQLSSPSSERAHHPQLASPASTALPAPLGRRYATPPSPLSSFH